MRKTSLATIRTALDSIDFENKDAIMEELDKELNKGVAERNAKTAEYENAFECVRKAMGMTTSPLTVAEIFEACEELPEGFTKNKVSYGLTHYWADRVVKIEGKVNTYRLPL